MRSFTTCALLSAGALSLVAAAPMPASTPQPQPPSQCYSGVYMIVARGSDESPGEGKPGEVADLVASQIPNSASVAVNYPASIADPPYPESVVDGIKDATAKIQGYVDSCGSSSKIVLIGFSQGGNIHTDILAGGVDKPAPLSSQYAQYITAVTVFGDPSYTPGQSFDQGNSTKGGIFEREPGGSSLALLNTYAGILQSYCLDNDIVCASGSSTAVHSSEVPTFAQAAAQFIVSKNG